ncbi:DivIVA domain-containing protein [Micromonospora cathayae]|uniref:Cell wall synthesis protein Wag31 n=1 Tax=Micromonospora cathayae TaxID=3028804 RepID=A0ABY7ZHW7_9ACTN|nr:DivIVA domain-containing protein [Micromonospora sp. HUAS 3]WDZ82580.1 DivIVA domain-containing protein [Micromonospora sp. HUAS 3]
MPHLTPADVHNVAFRKPSLGKRGYDEEEVDAFLDAVEQTIAALTAEVASLRAQLGHGAAPGTDPTAGAVPGAVAAELRQIKDRLARLEATVAGSAGSWPRTSDPLFGEHR